MIHSYYLKFVLDLNFLSFCLMDFFSVPGSYPRYHIACNCHVVPRLLWTVIVFMVPHESTQTSHVVDFDSLEDCCSDILM